MSTDELSRRAHQLHVLSCGEIEVVGRMPWSSNSTFLVDVRCGSEHAKAIYKPLRGERPLWDFEPGLHRREVAAYHLSEVLGFDLVPPTVLRDGPYGEGSMQWFVDVDHRQHYFTIHEERPDLHDKLRAVAVFDLLANNTDRKSGHVLIDADDHIWGIDHGLCFAADFKLRTVVWEFGGETIDQSLLEAIEPVINGVPLQIATLLDDDEVAALQERARWVAAHPV
ncbi:MAG TPA: SCO1664 family protein, partial [Ilumatobacteraceae bacterium]